MSNSLDEEAVFQEFMQLHCEQLQKLEVPRHLWHILSFKCSHSILDAGLAFSFEEVECDSVYNETANIDEEDSNTELKVCVCKEDGIMPDDKQQIYLIDHAYSYTLSTIRNELFEDINLRNRMAKLMKIPVFDRQVQEIVGDILREMWRYNEPYAYDHQQYHERVESTWYIMDEFGSGIRHSQDPSFRMVPFIYEGPPSIAYTLLFPIKTVSYGDEVTRNYVEFQYSDEHTYYALMLSWQYRDLTDTNFCPVEPPISFFQSGRVQESVPDFETALECTPAVSHTKLKVFCDYFVVNENLRHPSFEFVSSESAADVLWVNYQFKKFRELSASVAKYINQFPFEYIVTCKNLFAVVCRRNTNMYISDNSLLNTNPPWLPTTYNLRTEVCQFVSYFQQRERKGLDNIWICKPWNFSRGQDIHITNNLSCILKMRRTYPKIVCKYINDPVLFPIENVGLVKTDIRYIVLLKSIKPLELYSYKHFWLRFANKQFSLDDFEDYEKHFTVMNYRGSSIKQMYSDDFIKQFEEYYSHQKWKDIEAEIFGIFKQIFSAASSKAPPIGIFQNSQSRAIYGIDLMLQWDRTNPEKPRVQPMILENNFQPDCERACQYYPDFFNDIFDVLFLNNTNNPNVILL